MYRYGTDCTRTRTVGERHQQVRRKSRRNQEIWWKSHGKPWESPITGEGQGSKYRIVIREHQYRYHAVPVLRVLYRFVIKSD